MAGVVVKNRAWPFRWRGRVGGLPHVTAGAAEQHRLLPSVRFDLERFARTTRLARRHKFWSVVRDRHEADCNMFVVAKIA